MTIYLYNEPVFDKDGDVIDNKLLEITREEILARYWRHWKTGMIKKYGSNHYLITEDNCVEDWCTIYWAWQKDETEYELETNQRSTN